MYVRNKVSKDRKGRTVYRIQVVETRREGKKVKQEIVAHIGMTYKESEVARLLKLAEEAMEQEKAEREAQSKGFVV